MKHFRTEENQQIRQFKKQNILNTRSERASGKKTNMLFIDFNSFDCHKLLHYNYVYC